LDGGASVRSSGHQTKAQRSAGVIEHDHGASFRQRSGPGIECARPNPDDGILRQDFEEPLHGLDVQVDLRRLVVHRQDEPGSDGINQLGDQWKIDGRRAAGGNEYNLSDSQGGKLRLGELMSQVSEENQVQPLRTRHGHTR
jgi:hypothetical protein